MSGFAWAPFALNLAVAAGAALAVLITTFALGLRTGKRLVPVVAADRR